MRKSPRHSSRRAAWKSPAFIRRLSSWLVISTAITLAAGYGAQLYQWDPDGNSANNNVPTLGSGLGGTGTWNTTNTRWWSGAGPDVAWNNANFDFAEFGGLSGGTVTVGVPIVAGGLTFKTGGYVITPSATNTLTLQTMDGSAPIITANASGTIGVTNVSGIIGSQGVTKRGGGTLTVLGDNTGFTGAITVKEGTLALSGGSDATGTETKSLGNAQPITLEGGILSLRNDAGIASYLNDITLHGNATINVNNATTGSSNTIELADLEIGSNTLTTTNANTYGLRFMGTTMLKSAISTINATFSPAVGVVAGAGATTLAGQITGPGALNKTGTGTVFIFSDGFHADNDYAGGTNVFAGTLSVGDSFSQFGSGDVIVHPGTDLRIQDNPNFFSVEAAGAKLYLQSSTTAFGVLGLDGDFTPNTPALSGALISPIGAVVQINTSTAEFLNDFNFSNFGSASSGKVFLGAAQNTTFNGFAGQLTTAADNVYRLGSNNAAGTTLTLAIPNLINGGVGKSLIVGVPTQNVQNTSDSTGTVVVTESQNYGGLTTINTGSTLSTGGSGLADPARLGSGSTINIFGTLTLAGGSYVPLNQTTFNVSQARGTNGAMILTVTDPDFAGVGSTNARIAPTSVLNFFGGTLTFNGYSSGNAGSNPILSQQTVAQFNASAANTINVTTGNVVGENLDTILTLNVLNRLNNGTIAFTRTGQVPFGTTSNKNDIRVLIPSLNGGGAPSPTNGMIAPWLIETTSFNLPANGTTVSGSVNVTVSTSDGLQPGMILTGTNIPLGAAVTSVSPAVTLTGAQTNTATPTTILVPNTTGLVQDMIVSGSNIPTGARVVSIVPNTSFEISLPVTGTQANVTINSSALFTISTPATVNTTGQTFTATANQYLTYGANGLAAMTTNANPAIAGFDVYATTPALLQGATASQKVAITFNGGTSPSFTTSGDASVYALRIGDGTLNGTNTITIGAGAPAADGAGLILSQATARTHTPNFVFGTGGNREAVIFVGSSNATLSGTVSATGLTKFGPGTLILTNENANLNGTITINQGAIDGNPIGYNYRPIILNAGTLNYDTGGSTNVGSTVTVNGDSTITAGDVEVPRILSLTINARATSPDPIVFNISQGLSVAGTTTLNGNVSWNHTRADRNSDVRATALLQGQVTGVGSITKWGAGQTSFLSGTNNYSGGTTIHGGTLASQVGSAGTPFGSGAITLNPSGVIRLANASNIVPSQLTVNSDMVGIGVVSMIYNGSVATNGNLPAITFNNSAFGGPFSAVLAIDTVGYSGGINLATFGGGRAFLGSVLGGNFTGALTASAVDHIVPDLNGGAPLAGAGSVYRLGGGGNSNVQAGLAALNFMGAPNQLTGSNAVQIGVINNVTGGASVALAGGFGSVALFNANNYSGNTYLNTGGNLVVGENAALGTSKIIFNGGGIQADTSTGLPTLSTRRSVANNIGFTGDAVFNGATDLELSGNMALADNQIGVTRTFTVNNTTGLTILSGVISNGAGTAALGSITKAGAGPLVLTGANTYTGFTNINAGAIVVSSDTSIPASSQITFGGAGGAGVTGSIGVWNNSFTTNRNYIIQNGANGTFDIGAGKTLTQSTLSNISGIGADTALLKTGFGTLVLNAQNSFDATGSWAIRILNGIVQVSSNVNLGDPVANKGIVVQGGTLRVSDSHTSSRQIINGAATGGVDVIVGETFTSTGLLNSNGGTNVLTKTGPGTLLSDSNNASLDRFAIQNGVYSSSSFSPMADFISFTANTASNTTLSGFAPGVLNTLYEGQLVSGPGIAANSRITAIDYIANTATLSAATTATATGVALATGASGILALNGGTVEFVDRPVLSISGTSTAVIGNSVVTVGSTAGLRVGQPISGPNLQPGTMIAAITDGTTFLLSLTPTLPNSTSTAFTLGAAGNTTGIGNLSFGGGGRLKVQSSPSLSTQVNVNNLTRTANGTLILDPGTSNLAVAGNGNNVRVVPVTSINGISVGSANVNGILAPNIVTQTAGVGNFATYVNPTLGIASYSGPTVASLNGLQPTAIGNIVAPQALTGTNSIYAFRTTSNITGGTLKFSSINSNTEGGVLVNADATIGSNLLFDPTTAVTYSLTGAATTNASATVTVANTAGLLPGMPISGPNIPVGATIASVTDATTLVISANATATATGLTFTAQQGTANSGEGLLYVAPTRTATVNGQIMSNGFVKFGEGGLTLNAAGQGILGTLTIQDGILKLVGGTNFNRLQTDLILNNQAALDLNGGGATFNGLGNSAGVANGGIAGGLVGTSSATAGVFTVSGATNSSFGGRIVDGGIGAGSGVTSLVKSGTGTLTLARFSVNNPDAGNNTFTGGTTVNQGSLVVQDPRAVGTGAINLRGGTLNLQSNGGGINGTIILGDQNGSGATVNVWGPATINVANGGANSGNDWQIGALNLTENTLTISGANNYRLRVAGPTQILGKFANIANNTDVSALVLDGVISGSGALNKTGAALNQRVLTINGTANTYSGGTNIVGGMVQVTGNSGNPLGTGPVKVFAGAELRIAGNSSLGAATLQTLSRVTGMGMVSLDNDFDPMILTASNFHSIYGTVLGLSQPFFTTGLNMSTIGSGRSFLGAGIGGLETAYIATTLGAGLADAAVPGTPVYRLSGGAATLAFTGVDNVLTGNAFVQFGNPLVNTGTGQTFGQGTVVIRNSNNFTGGASIAKGTTVFLDVGASPAGSTPLGSADGMLSGAVTNVEVYGTLSTGSPAGYAGVASFVNALTGKNANNVILRPGGLVTITDVPGNPPGGQGRWADSDANGGALNLNGGTFRFTGAANYGSTEAVGTFTASKGAGISVVRGAGGGTVALNLGALTRAAGGTLSITSGSAYTLGIPIPIVRQTGSTTNGSATVTVTSSDQFTLGQVLNGAGIPAGATIIAIPNATTVRISANATATASGVALTSGNPTQLNFEQLTVAGGAASIGGRAGTTVNGAGVVNGGIVAPWMIDATNNTFLGYDVTGAGTGFQPLLDTVAPGAGQIAYSIGATGTLTSTAADTVDVGGSVTAFTGNAQSAYAMRIATPDVTVSNGATPSTLTIQSGGLILNASGIVIDPVTAGQALPQMTLAFGAEAFIYTGGGATNPIINAQITGTSGLTKFGTGLLQIQSNNPGLTGPVTLNAGTLTLVNSLGANGTSLTGPVNGQNITLNGGTLNIDGLLGNRANTAANVLAVNVRATTNLGSNITFAGDATITNNNQGVFQRFNNLTLVDLGVRSPISATINTGIYVAGTTTLGANNNNVIVNFQQFSNSVFGGAVSGGTLIKFGNGSLLMASGANSYGATVINAASQNDATSIVGSLTRTGTPFGTGPITVNPGGMLRIASLSNISSNLVTLNSDGSGLAGIAVAYNGALPTFGAGVGQINASTTGGFGGVLALDINAYTTTLNQSTIGGGNMWLGTSVGSIYFAPTLGAGNGGVYRLGGGGNQGNLQIGGGGNTVGLFENVLSGANNVEVGAMISGINANGSFYVNGNIGTVSLNNRNLGLSGYVSANAGTLAINNAFALGSGVLRLNGGNLSFNNLPTVANNVEFIGDTFVTTGGDSAQFTGNFNLAPGGVGGTRTFNIGGTNHVGINGVISGGPGSNVIKAGASSVVFNGTNTYQGTTTINAGFIMAGTNVQPGVNGALGNSETPIAMGGGSLGIAGQFDIARSIILTASGTVRGQSLNNSVVTGGIAITAGTLTIDQTQGVGAATTVGGAAARGGVIDIQGPISGGGSVTIGAGSNTSLGGIVRLGGNANGFSTNTFTGGVTLQAARLQIGADTYFTGPATTPTIISGPLGTGTFNFGTGNTNLGGAIEAFGGARTIVNALGAINSLQGTTVASTTHSFTGHNSLTFIRNLDISSNATVASRTFNVLATQCVLTFSGDLSNSGVLGANLVKSGVGTLVLSGTNTQANLDTANANYGRGIFIDAGTVSVGADVNLGSSAALAAAGTHLLGPADVVLRGGVLQSTGSFSTDRQFILTANSGIDVTGSNTLTLSKQTAGAFGITKTGNGTLALNNNANTLTSLIIGGAPLATAANQFSGASGGTVSTTATTGTPFVAVGGAITINGGALSLLGAGANLAVATVNYGGGSYIGTNAGGATLTIGTALTRVAGTQATLTLLPSAIANLGGAGTEKVIVSAGAPAAANGVLTTPNVYVRLAGVGQDANFATYVGGTGFQQHAAATVATLAATAATSIGDIGAGGTTVGAGTISVMDVRTAGNIAPTDGTSLLSLTGGGLIINGTTAPVISSNLVFGTTATPVEALVYVRDGQTGNSTISGNFTAADFTKAGPGTLLISGTGNVMAPLSTGLRTLAINEGAVQFAGQSSLPSAGRINIATLDSGTLDLAGQALTIGGLSGTGLVTNSGAAQVLNADVRNQTTTFNGQIAGGVNVGLTKSGIGTLVLGNRNSYAGGTIVNAGNITSANGVYTPLGTLSVNAFDGLGTGGVTLAGGILNIAVTTPGNEVDDNFDTIQFGPGNGYDFTISALNNFGSANTTSTINTTSTAVFQAINSLTINAPVLTFAGASANGLLVRGATTFAGNTVLNLNGTQTAVLGGTLNAAGSTLTKIGGATLFLTNTGTGGGADSAAANTVGAWKLMAGATEVRMSQGGSNPLGAGTPVTLNGGTLNIRHDGDNLLDPQVLSDFAGTNFTIGSTAAASSTNYVSSVNSTINIDRVGTSANKTIQIGAAAFGGPIGAGFLSQSVTTANLLYNLEITGGVTMIKDAYFALNNTDTTISGTISGNGTLFKQGGGSLDINTTANTATGGTVLAGGSTFFGSFRGNTRELSTTTKLAAGNITVQPGALLRFTGVGNVNGAQLVDLRSNLNSYAVLGIGDNAAPSAYHLRTPQASGAFSGNMQVALNTGAGVLALNTVYTQALNLATIGDGTWFLGSTTNGSFQQGSYNAATLGTGKAYNFGIGSANNADAVIRLGAGGSILYIGSDGTDNAITDVSPAIKTSLVVGAPLTSSFAGTVGNGAGTAILYGDQNYTGTTLVNRGSTLSIFGTVTTPSYETFGTLNVSGASGRFFNGATPLQPTLRAGSELGLRNDFDLLPIGATEGRYGDATAVNLNSSTLRLVGSNAADILERVGAVSVAGGSFLIPNRSFGGRITELNLASLTRVGQGQLSISPAAGGQLGSDERVTLAGANLAAQVAAVGGITNGMVSPWIYNQTDVQFVTYSDFGFVNAGFDRVFGTAGTIANNTSLPAASERLQVTAAATIGAGTTLSVHAVRADANIVGTNAETLSIGSGGLISNAAATITAATSTAGELVIVNQNNLIFGSLTNAALDSVGTGVGKITATSISKAGTGNMFMDSDHTSFTGPIALNNGGLFMREIQAGATNNGGAGSVITINGANATLGFRGEVAGTIFNNSVVIPAGNPLVNINVDRADAAGTGILVQIAGGLTFGGSPGDQGQILNLTNGNTFALQVNGTANLGPVGNAAFSLNAGSGNLTLGGVATNRALTGAGTLIKQGQAQLNLGLPGTLPTVASDNTGGVIVQAGTLQANAGAQAGVLLTQNNITLSQLGSGDITLVGGTLNLRLDGDNSGTNRTYFYASNPNVNVLGNSTINVDRITTNGGTNKTVAFGNLNIGGQTLTNTVGNTYSLRFNAVSLSGMPTFNVGNDPGLTLSGVSDGGAALYIVKNGGAQIWFDDRLTGSVTADAVNTFSGGLYINQGTLRFGNVLTESLVAQAGTGNIQINAQGAIRVADEGNIGTSQTVRLAGVAPSLPVFRFHGTNLGTGGLGTVQANLVDIITSNSTAATLRMESADVSQALDLGALGDGTLYLGAQGSRSYTANTLGVGTGATYRLGANDAGGTALTLSPATATSNVLTGANRVLIGSLAAGGGTGTVVLNNDNDYSGGTTVVRGSTLVVRSGVTAGDTPLGSAQVDVFGTITAASANGTFVASPSTTTNTNTFVFHPGANLSLDGNTAPTGVTAGNNTNRWGDNTAISLNGSNLSLTSANNTGISETVGAVDFARGSRINVSNTGTGIAANVLALPSLTRTGSNATLVFVPSGAFGTNAADTDNVVVSGGLPATVGGGVNMLPAYYINGFANAAGRSFVTDAGGGSNRLINVAYTSTNFVTPAATSIVDVTATTALSGDVTVQAMRVGGSAATALTINNATGQFNTITLNGAAGGGGILNTAANTINPNLNFNNQEGLIYTEAALTLNGDISGVGAAGITKFGASTLTIGKDQSNAARGPAAGYSNGWTVNEGTLVANFFGALGNATGTNTVTLNGSALGAAGLTLGANQASALNEFYSMGNLLVTDNALITHNPVNPDRTQSLGAAGSLSNVIVTSTGGALLDAQLAYTSAQQRSILQVGDVSAVGANARVILNIGQTVINNNLTSGAGIGLSIASLSGSADQTFKKWGNAELYIRGASTFAGTVSIEQGSVAVFNNAGLGTGAVTVKRFGTLDIWTPNFTPANSSLTYEAGSMERWSVDGARTGAINLGGATLQVNNDQTGAVAVTLNGGSIEGFIKVDDNVRTTNGNQGAVYRTLGSNVSFLLAGDSFLGQNINQGVNGLDNGAQPNVFQPFGNAAAGVILEVKGAITGVGSLTKQGYDTVTLSGANTYAGGTFVTQGMLRIGATNSLPTTGTLSTSGAAVFDMNGFDQTVGRLSSPGSIAAGSSAVSGYVTNSSTELKTLTVGNGSLGNATYSGVIQYNVAVTKNGASIQTLTGNNTYVGATTISAGALEVSGSLSGTTKVDVNTGGTLTGAGLAAGPVNLNGGIFSPGAAGLTAATAGENSVGTFNAAGGFNITSSSTLKLDLQTGVAVGTPGGGSVNDKINVTGAISLTGTTTIALTLTGAVSNGNLFFIGLNDGADAIAGGPANFSVPGVGGFNWQVFTNADSVSGNTFGGNDIAILAIPEPNALTLLASSLSLAVGLQRFRRRRHS